MMVYAARAMLEFARGRQEDAMTAQRATESVERGLVTQHILASRAQARRLEIMVRSGEAELVRQALDDMDEDLRATTAMRVVQATASLAHDDPEAAEAALAPSSRARHRSTTHAGRSRHCW
jgi:LuxR family transcriptional regulator, maltose regulon positive regulatory protein